MTHSRLVPFDIAHIQLLDLAEDMVDEVFTMPKGIDYLAECASTGDSFTMICDGRVIACGGVYVLWEGVGQVWLLPSKHLSRYPVAAVRTIKRMLDAMVESHNFHRLQAIISTKLDVGPRWIEMLGFTREGVLGKYTPQGTDYLMYARIR